MDLDTLRQGPHPTPVVIWSKRWTASECPALLPRTPRLISLKFTPIAQAPWYVRAVHFCKNLWARLRGHRRCVPFVPPVARSSLLSGYLVVDLIEPDQVTMLSEAWPPPGQHKSNLYRSLAKIMLDMARHPLPMIGSFPIGDTSALYLNSRPLTKQLHLLERQGIHRTTGRASTYVSTDAYVSYLERWLDSKLAHQPNAIRDENDADAQMATHTMVRVVKDHVMQEHLRTGPFSMKLTDLHQSKFFVDAQFNITAVVDLDRTCALPREFQHPPFWLTGHDLDEFETEERKQELAHEWMEFMYVFESEETSQGPPYFSTIMRQAVDAGTPWYLTCFAEPRGTYSIFLHQIQPIFAPEHAENLELGVQFEKIPSKYWTARI